MCDTLISPPSATRNGATLFAKNSDRQRNEAQIVELRPEATYLPSTELQCTYISIPQTERTYATLLCRPYWMWGAEMGANACGVVIGNEGLHARVPAPKTPALTGMDLVRLGLERGATALEAAETIVALLEIFGQGGNGGHLDPAFYNNGFLIADATQAYVLETVGREWLLERVAGPRSLSNIYSIDNHAERVSAHLADLIGQTGCDPIASAGYAGLITDPNREHIGQAGARRKRSTDLMGARVGMLDALAMMAILRDHRSVGYEAAWHPARAKTIDLCMHAGAPDRAGQTTGSLVSDLRGHHAVHWVTATAAPCLSIFKPLLFGISVPPHGPPPQGQYDADSLWWRHERMHRHALKADIGAILREFAVERDALESIFYARMIDVLEGGDAVDRAHVITGCWAEATAAEFRWMRHSAGIEISIPPAYRFEWARLNSVAGMPSDLKHSHIE